MVRPVRLVGYNALNGSPAFPTDGRLASIARRSVPMSWFLIMFVAGPLLGVVYRSVARRLDAPADPRACRACQIEHPAFAGYCRRCGRRL
jgi:hypothetical protein